MNLLKLIFVLIVSWITLFESYACPLSIGSYSCFENKKQVSDSELIDDFIHREHILIVRNDTRDDSLCVLENWEVYYGQRNRLSLDMISSCASGIVRLNTWFNFRNVILEFKQNGREIHQSVTGLSVSSSKIESIHYICMKNESNNEENISFEGDSSIQDLERSHSFTRETSLKMTDTKAKKQRKDHSQNDQKFIVAPSKEVNQLSSVEDQQRNSVNSFKDFPKQVKVGAWNKFELKTLREAVKKQFPEANNLEEVSSILIDWNKVAIDFRMRSPRQCRDRWKTIFSHYKSGTWQSDEDDRLIAAAEEYENIPEFSKPSRGDGAWIATRVGTRSAEQCVKRIWSLKSKLNRLTSGSSRGWQKMDENENLLDEEGKDLNREWEFDENQILIDAVKDFRSSLLFISGALKTVNWGDMASELFVRSHQKYRRTERECRDHYCKLLKEEKIEHNKKRERNEEAESD